MSHCMYMPHFVYPFVDRHLGYHLSALVNDAALNTAVHVSKFIFLGFSVVGLG